MLDGEVYRVVVSRGSGRLYALLLVEAPGAFEYAPGAVRRLSEDTLMTLEEARDYGVQHGTNRDEWLEVLAEGLDTKE